MKLTKTQLKRIIKEELEAVMNESEFDYISHLEHLAVRNPELKYMADELRGDPADRRYNWDLIQQALKMLGPVDDGDQVLALEIGVHHPHGAAGITGAALVDADRNVCNSLCPASCVDVGETLVDTLHSAFAIACL